MHRLGAQLGGRRMAVNGVRAFFSSCMALGLGRTDIDRCVYLHVSGEVCVYVRVRWYGR